MKHQDATNYGKADQEGLVSFSVQNDLINLQEHDIVCSSRSMDKVILHSEIIPKEITISKNRPATLPDIVSILNKLEQIIVPKVYINRYANLIKIIDQHCGDGEQCDQSIHDCQQRLELVNDLISKPNIQKQVPKLIAQLKAETDVFKDLEIFGIDQYLASGLTRDLNFQVIKIPKFIQSVLRTSANYDPHTGLILISNQSSFLKDNLSSLAVDGTLANAVTILHHESIHALQHNRLSNFLINITFISGVFLSLELVMQYLGYIGTIGVFLSGLKIANISKQSIFASKIILSETLAYRLSEGRNCAYYEESDYSLSIKSSIIDRLIILGRYLDHPFSDADVSISNGEIILKNPNHPKARLYHMVNNAYDLIDHLILLGIPQTELVKAVDNSSWDNQAQTFPKLKEILMKTREQLELLNDEDYINAVRFLNVEKEVIAFVERSKAARITRCFLDSF